MVILRAKCVIAGMYVLFLLVVFKFVKYLGKFSCKVICLCRCSNNDTESKIYLLFSILQLGFKLIFKLFNTVRL